LHIHIYRSQTNEFLKKINDLYKMKYEKLKY
jgi:hypothetical protein